MNMSHPVSAEHLCEYRPVRLITPSMRGSGIRKGAKDVLNRNRQVGFLDISNLDTLCMKNLCSKRRLKKLN